MDKEPEVKEKMATAMEEVQSAIGENLDHMEAQVDSTVEQAVHEIRSEAQEVADRAVDRFRGFWKQAEEELDGQVSRHPWLALGGLLLIGYLFARARQSRPN